MDNPSSNPANDAVWRRAKHDISEIRSSPCGPPDGQQIPAATQALKQGVSDRTLLVAL
jgi:hypothetical protein